MATDDLVEIKKNQVIFKIGEKPEFFYLIISGNVEQEISFEMENIARWPIVGD